jgi:hypothetical protein
MYIKIKSISDLLHSLHSYVFVYWQRHWDWFHFIFSSNLTRAINPIHWPVLRGANLQGKHGWVYPSLNLFCFFFQSLYTHLLNNFKYIQPSSSQSFHIKRKLSFPHKNLSQIADTVKTARQLRVSTLHSSNLSLIQLMWQTNEQKNWRVNILMWLSLVFN